MKIARVPVLALALAMTASFLSIGSASAAERDHHGDDRGRRGEEHSRRAPPRHRYPVYVPAPAYYPQQESPGINLVFPIVIH